MSSTLSPQDARPFLITGLGQEGDGRTQDDQFIPLSLPGDEGVVYQDGRIDLKTLSPYRQSPPCVHFGDCGGCALQHMTPDFYQDFKTKTLKDLCDHHELTCEMGALKSFPMASRRRLSLHAKRIGKDIILGFKRKKSWDIVPLTMCAIAHPALEAAIEPLKGLAKYLFEKPKSAPILHLTHTQTGIDVDISGVQSPEQLSLETKMTLSAVSQKIGLARLSMGQHLIYQDRAPMITIGLAKLALPHGAFLQASCEAEAYLQEQVRSHIKNRKNILDLFCGIGTFTLDIAKTHVVTGYDSNAEAVIALKKTHAQTQGLKPLSAHKRDLFREPLIERELKGFDCVVLDPPRAGCELQCKKLSLSEVKTIIYVSCMPKTFVRDAKILIAGGYTLKQIKPVDQFIFSPHLELVSVFERM